MWDLNAEGVWPFHFSKIGRWWEAGSEIDIAALDPEGENLILGECKYWKEPVGMNVLQDLEKKAELVPWRKPSRCNWYILFSMGGFTDDLKKLAEIRNDLLLVDDRD